MLLHTHHEALIRTIKYIGHFNFSVIYVHNPGTILLIQQQIFTYAQIYK